MMREKSQYMCVIISFFSYGGLRIIYSLVCVTFLVFELYGGIIYFCQFQFILLKYSRNALSLNNKQDFFWKYSISEFKKI